VVVGIFTAVIIGALYWFFGTELGSSIRATGANGNMARAQGINTNFNKVLGLALANGLVALSGALLSQYQGFAEINMGRGAIVIGLAAIIIGEVIFSKIFINFGLKLLAVSIGAVIYYMVVQFVVSVLAINTDYLKLFSALIVAVFLDLGLEATQKIVEKDHLTTLMITHNMRDAIAYGNRLIMMYNGHIVVDVSGEEKKNLTVEQLLNLFSQASGSDEVDDKLVLS
jgi:ABC-type uncharacterized transport system permease subunit